MVARLFVRFNFGIDEFDVKDLFLFTFDTDCSFDARRCFNEFFFLLLDFEKKRNQTANIHPGGRFGRTDTDHSTFNYLPENEAVAY